MRIHPVEKTVAMTLHSLRSSTGKGSLRNDERWSWFHEHAATDNGRHLGWTDHLEVWKSLTGCRVGMRIGFAAIVGLAMGPTLNAQNEQLWPSINFYKTMSEYSRFYLQLQSTRENQTGQDVQIGPCLDFYLKRRLALLRHNEAGTDESRARPLLFRIGYNYIPSTDNPTEQRVILELTPRLPVKAGFVLADRTRGDLRFINGQFSTRYRNRLSLERPFKLRGHAFTPYVRAEAYYDTRYAKWNKTALDVGGAFVLRKHWELESYFEHQNDTSKNPNSQVEAVAIEVNMHF